MSDRDRIKKRQDGEAFALSLRVVLAEFTLELNEILTPSGVTAVFGRSGSGKTTLLRAIAGFEKPVRGRIALGDQVWFDEEAKVFEPPNRRSIGMLFQDVRLFPHLDVRGNLDFAWNRRNAWTAKAGMQQNIARDEVIEALDLDIMLGRNVTSLSGGEQQRVALARTLLTSPDLLLLDEPLAALDRERKAEILPYLEDVTRRFMIPTLFVSHDLDEVARLADRMMVLSEGQVQMYGETAEILERLDLEPIGGRFEAGVLVEGKVLRHDTRLHLTTVDLDGDALAIPLAEGSSVGDILRLRVRARDVALATERPAGLSIRNVLPGEITDLIRTPGSGEVEARVQLRSAHIRARLTLAAVEELGLAPGRRVFVLVKSVSLEGGR